MWTSEAFSYAPAKRATSGRDCLFREAFTGHGHGGEHLNQDLHHGNACKEP